MRLDKSSRKADRREAAIKRNVEGYAHHEPARSEPRINFYRNAEDCGHLAHVTQIVNERCQYCQELTVRDGNGNLIR